MFNNALVKVSGCHKKLYSLKLRVLHGADVKHANMLKVQHI